MANAAPRGVDAVLIVQRGKEVWRLVDRIAVRERLAVQVAVDAGSRRAARLAGFSVKHQTARAPTCLAAVVAVESIDVDECVIVRVADVFGHGKGKREETLLHLVAAAEERVDAVVVDERFVGTLVRRVVVSGVNIVKKAMKKRSQQDQGGIAEIEAPLNISNVAIVCKKCGPTKIGYKIDGDKKVRVCRKCGDVL